MALQSDYILKYIYEHYESYWKQKRNIGYKKFGLAIGVPDIQAHEYTRTVQKKDKTPRRILARLDRGDTRHELSILLGVDIGIFDTHTEHALDEIITAKIKQADSENDDDLCFVIDGATSSGARQVLHNNELMVLDKIISLIDAGSHDILLWPVSPIAGPSFLTVCIAKAWALQHVGAKAYVILPYRRPYQLIDNFDTVGREKPFDSSLHQLGRLLGISKPQGRIAPQIREKLIDQKSILFVMHADEISEIESTRYYSAIHDLIRSAIGRREQNAHTPIVLVGDSPFRPNSSAIKVAHSVLDMLPIRAANDRYHYFFAQWCRFCESRGNEQSDYVGARAKRARWYYFESKKDSDVYPTDIRVRAFFASNYKMHSYFDPTAGWERLAGMPTQALPEDIRLHYRDVLYQLKALPVGKRRPETRIVRWCSTAIYWLTEEAAIDLGRQIDFKGQNGEHELFRSKISVNSINSALQNIESIVQTRKFNQVFPADTAYLRISTDQNVYFSRLSVKSIVQDIWKIDDPFDRSYAHFRVARRLYDARDDKEQLNHEFPVIPHWGRSRIFFLSECLRHLMRSCESSFEEKNSRTIDPFSSEFPKGPEKLICGTSPVEVVNFCFGELYWRQLNGNRRVADVNNRSLSRRHGAYQLAAELLQLMSKDNILGMPHDALHERHISQYLREVSYVLLDLGELSASTDTFRRLTRYHEERGEKLECVESKLDLVIVLTTAGALVEADAVLQEVEQARLEDMSQEVNAVQRRRIGTIRRRTRARRAHLCYLNNDIEEAEAIFRALPSTNLVRETAHVYIATLGRLNSEIYMNSAMNLCLRNLFSNSSEGLHHEALGFRIVLGHLFRKMNMLESAEACLDQVYIDILRFGCSERTYLAFLLEAGRIVSKQGRYLRAYAGYLRPAFDRALSRGYFRVARSAKKHACECLNFIMSSYFGYSDGTQWSQYVRGDLLARGEFVGMAKLTSADPLFSFDFVSNEDWALRLDSRDKLTEELENLTNIDV